MVKMEREMVDEEVRGRIKLLSSTQQNLISRLNQETKKQNKFKQNMLRIQKDLKEALEK